MTKSPWQCSDYWLFQLYISITDFDTEETDDSYILITIIDSMGKPEETKRLDKTNYYIDNWIQDGYLNTGAKITIWGQMTFQTPFLFYEYKIEKFNVFEIKYGPCQKINRSRLFKFLKNICVRIRYAFIIDQHFMKIFLSIFFKSVRAKI